MAQPLLCASGNTRGGGAWCVPHTVGDPTMLQTIIIILVLLWLLGLLTSYTLGGLLHILLVVALVLLVVRLATGRRVV